MYPVLVIVACVLFAATFVADLRFVGRDAPRPARSTLVAIFGGLAVSLALLMIARSLGGRAAPGDGLWGTILNRAPDYVPLMIFITASMTCSNLFFGNSEQRRADKHISVPARPKLPGEEHGPAGH